MSSDWRNWDSLSWGEQAKLMYSGKAVPKEQVKDAMDRCQMPYTKERCEECPFHNKGCSQHLDIAMYDMVKRIHDYEENRAAKKLIKNFEVCFSGGLPDRCLKCDFKGRSGCSRELLRQSWALIEKEEKNQHEKQKEDESAGTANAV
jgi:ABC-type glutathione transport system ATPase component